MAIDNNIDIENEQGLKDKVGEKLGQFGRQLKKIDLRKQIVSYPYPAIGIAFAAGAIVGLVRPKPQPGRFSSLLFTTLGAIGFRLIREAAVRELGNYAKSRFLGHENQAANAGFGAQNEGGNVRYSPSV
jgi:hypothetical protein